MSFLLSEEVFWFIQVGCIILHLESSVNLKAQKEMLPRTSEGLLVALGKQTSNGFMLFMESQASIRRRYL